MISSALTVRAPLREPQPPVPPTGYESPQDARDGGWLGQVPPDDAPVTPRCPAPVPDGTPPVTGHESTNDAREGGWLGQVPPAVPPTPRCPPAQAARSLDEIELGDETSHELRERGWLGQVPPDSAYPPAPAPVEDAPSTQYANPQLAPEPWKDSGSLYLDDPTLFG